MLVLTLVIYKSNRFDAFGILFVRSVPIFVKYLLNSSAIFFVSKMSVLLTVILVGRVEDLSNPAIFSTRPKSQDKNLNILTTKSDFKMK